MYVLKRASSAEIARVLRNAMLLTGGADEERVREAILEAEHAIRRVLAEGVTIPLAPRPPSLRRIQHQLIARYHLETTSMGSEPMRHLVVYPPDGPNPNAGAETQGAPSTDH
jgi:phage gp36-like protein